MDSEASSRSAVRPWAVRNAFTVAAFSAAVEDEAQSDKANNEATPTTANIFLITYNPAACSVKARKLR
jgi:hypothetical protein